MELLRAEGLSLDIRFAPLDDEGWMWWNAVIHVPGFRGDLDFQMLKADLYMFRTRLSASTIAENWPCDARLASTDPGMDLSFRVERTGQVVGEYQFGGCRAQPPLLSGTFGMDQTYLGPLLAQIDGVLADLD